MLNRVPQNVTEIDNKDPKQQKINPLMSPKIINVVLSALYRCSRLTDLPAIYPYIRCNHVTMLACSTTISKFPIASLRNELTRLASSKQQKVLETTNPTELEVNW
jgi:hypothetical protein